MSASATVWQIDYVAHYTRKGDPELKTWDTGEDSANIVAGDDGLVAAQRFRDTLLKRVESGKSEEGAKFTEKCSRVDILGFKRVCGVDYDVRSSSRK